MPLHFQQVVADDVRGPFQIGRSLPQAASPAARLLRQAGQGRSPVGTKVQGTARSEYQGSHSGSSPAAAQEGVEPEKSRIRYARPCCQCGHPTDDQPPCSSKLFTHDRQANTAPGALHERRAGVFDGSTVPS